MSKNPCNGGGFVQPPMLFAQVSLLFDGNMTHFCITFFLSSKVYFLLLWNDQLILMACREKEKLKGTKQLTSDALHKFPIRT